MAGNRVTPKFDHSPDGQDKTGEREAAMDIELIAETEADKAKAIQVLGALYTLLEDYAPSWYPEDLHYQAEAALRALRAASHSS